MNGSEPEYRIEMVNIYYPLSILLRYWVMRPKGLCLYGIKIDRKMLYSVLGLGVIQRDYLSILFIICIIFRYLFLRSLPCYVYNRSVSQLLYLIRWSFISPSQPNRRATIVL